MIKNINVSLYKDNRRELDFNNIKALSVNDTLSFIVDEIKTSINDNYFIRENDEFKFELDILNKTASYLLKENNNLFDIDVEEVIITKEDNTIIIEYKISSDENNIKIIIEENKNE